MGSKFSHGITCFLFLVTIFAIKAKTDDIDLDIKKFGAKLDGKTGDTAVRTTFVYEIEQCSLQIRSVTGGAHPNAWITFQNIKNLSIYGEGTFDGKGVDKDCPSTTTGNKCTSKPMNLLFFRVTNAEIGDITSTNSDYVHIGIFESTNVLIEDVNIYEMGSDGILSNQQKLTSQCRYHNIQQQLHYH
ncbi:hypothetical protein ACFX2I_007781 [Malus domestica]